MLNSELTIDATRSGNMAHLINHSCAPLCHSRAVTVRCAETGELQDHVIIIASRDLPAGVRDGRTARSKQALFVRGEVGLFQLM